MSGSVMHDYTTEPTELSDFDNFWITLHQKTGRTLPKYLKNAMRINGFDDAYAIQLITSDDIDFLENFIKTEIESYIKPTDDKRDFYNEFHDKVHLFKIVRGHRMKLLELANFLKVKLASKDGAQFFSKCKSVNSDCDKNVEPKEPSLGVLQLSSTDIERERNDLKAKTVIWMKTYASDLYSQYAIFVEQSMVEARIETHEGKHSLVCYIVCPVCMDDIKAIKVSKTFTNGLTGEPTWCHSNFQKHVKRFHENFITHSRSKRVAKNSCVSANTAADTICIIVEQTNSTNNSNEPHEQEFNPVFPSEILSGSTETLEFDTLSNFGLNLTSDNTNFTTPVLVSGETSSAISTSLAVHENFTLSKQELEDNIHEQTTEFEGKEGEKIVAIEANEVKTLPRAKRRRVQELYQMSSPASSPGEDSCSGQFRVEVLSNRNPLQSKIELLRNSSANPGDPESDPSFLLSLLLKAAQNNLNKNKKGYRHDSILKMFAAYLKMIAGPLAYETIYANLPLCLPSPSIVNGFIQEKGPHIIEGEFRYKELYEFLVSRNLPLIVGMSEDATRVTPKVTFDPTTNQLVGFALPLDANGIPITKSFLARNAKEIEEHFNNENNSIANYAYAIMIEPVMHNSPKFCLSLFSTDNKFKSLHVSNRWEVIKNNLKKYGIVLDSAASDGDGRCLRSMKDKSGIGNADKTFLDCEWYSCGMLSSNDFEKTVFIQDPTHVATKDRNWVLKKSRLTPFGDKVISSGHLSYLIDNVSKDKHLLTRTDIEPKDRQNFASAEKISDLKTIECLLKYVPGSEGTALFLKVMNFSITPYLNPDLSAKERVYRMWFAVFVIRIWRSWILSSDQYTLKQSFISLNLYTCIELNAHSIVKQVIKAKENSFPFVPHAYSSQPCEGMFRQIRSMSTTSSTVVNCSMLDIIHRLNRIQLQSDIIQECGDQIRFPRMEKKVQGRAEVSDSSNLPDRNEIITEIERAKSDAIDDVARYCGVTNMKKINFKCQVRPTVRSPNDQSIAEEEDTDDEESDDELEEFEFGNEDMAEEILSGLVESEVEEYVEQLSDAFALMGVTGPLQLRNYPQSTLKGDLNEDSRFAVVNNNLGKEILVRKSSICWLLSKNKYKLSADRLQRVKENEIVNIGKPMNQRHITQPGKRDEIFIGDWCVFTYDENVAKRMPLKRVKPRKMLSKNLKCVHNVLVKKKIENTPMRTRMKKPLNIAKMKNHYKKKKRCTEPKKTKKIILLGLVLSFCNLNGTNFSTKAYYRQSATTDLVVGPQNAARNKSKVFNVAGNNIKVGVLCSWFELNSDGTLRPYKTQEHKFVNISFYEATITAPIFKNNSLFLPQTLIKPTNTLVNIIKSQMKFKMAAM